MDITRRDNISYEEFIEEHYKPGIPLIFTGAANACKENNVFRPDWFKKNYPDKTAVRDGRTYYMKEIMDLAENGADDNEAPFPFKFNIQKQLPELIQWIRPLDLNNTSPNWFSNKMFSIGKWGGATELLIGGRTAKTNALYPNYYHLNSWITQLYGEKQFTVFPRGQENLLYPSASDRQISGVNILNPDLEKYPKFKDATPITFVLGPGETLFIPFGTWHTEQSLTPTLSVGFDTLNSKNHKEFLKSIWTFNSRGNKLKAVASYAYAWFASLRSRINERVAVK